MAARQMLQAERVAEARRILEAAPSRVSNSPVIVTLRSLLAPPTVTTSTRKDVDRSREYEWLRTHASKYRGLWLALRGDRLLASARTLHELRELLARESSTPPAPLIHRVE